MREGAGRGQIGKVHDQRVEPGPALGLEYPRHRPVIRRIAAKAIDGFGREGDQIASA